MKFRRVARSVVTHRDESITRQFGLQLRQVARSIVQSDGSRRSGQSGAQPGAVGLRYAAQPGSQLRLEAAPRQDRRLDALGRYALHDTSLVGTIPNGINNDGVDTPNYLPGNLAVNTNPRNGRAAFHTALFSLPAMGQLGTAARRFFYGPGMANFDMAVHKNVRLSESRTIELRLEACNVFNHAQFYGAAAVNGNIGSASFGQIVNAQAPRQIQLAAKFRF